MAKIGLYGGTFNPIHYGHLRIAEEARQFAGLDEVQFIPNLHPPHRGDPNVTARDRANMVRLAIAGDPHFSLNTIELERDTPSYSYDTVRLLKERSPRDEFYFISGSDVVVNTTWYRMDDLLGMLAGFCVISRPETPQELLKAKAARLGFKNSGRFLWIQTNGLTISSTLIRNLVGQGQSPRYLLPDSVARYIEEKGLYLHTGQPVAQFSEDIKGQGGQAESQAPDADYFKPV